MATIQSTVNLVSATDISYTDPSTGSFTATRLEVSDTTGAFYQVLSLLIYSGQIYIEEGVLNDTARIIEVEDSTHIVVEQLVNTASYTVLAQVTYQGYDGTADTGELAKNSVGLLLYPSMDKASQGVNIDRMDIKVINDSLNLSQIVFQNLSQGCILRADTSNDGYVKLIGTNDRKIVYANAGDLFLENAACTLDVATVGDNQFIDIYIEDSGGTPILSGTKRIELVGKASGLYPNTTSATTGQYLIANVYIYNGKIIGIYNYETINAEIKCPIGWSNSNFNISGTSYTYFANKLIYLPVFVTSDIYFNLTCSLATGNDTADALNFYIGMVYDNTTSCFESIQRKGVMATSTNVLYETFPIAGKIAACTAGLHTLMIGGKIGTTDADPKATISVSNLAGCVSIVPNEFSFNTEV